MNINLIKAELEKLSLVISSWEDEQSVSAIERDIALDKLKTLYDLVRFDSETQPTPAPVVPAQEPEPTVEEATEDEVADDEEKDVEVELIFAEDDDMFTLPSAESEEEAEEGESPISLASEILASAIGATAVKEEAEPVAEPAVEPATEPIAEVEIEAEEDEEEVAEEGPATSEEEEAEEIIVEDNKPEEIAPEPVAEPTPAPEPEPEPIPTPEPEKVAEREEPLSLNNLFGMEEVKRRPRTKHQRMMSIYSDSEPRQEKVVDISKIFDMEIDAPIPMTSKIADFTPEPEPARPAVVTPAPEPAVEVERPKTLADAISPSTQTLADKLAAPTALGEEIHNSRIASLRDGIGLNDKFLMIRDLFDGDGDAYNEAIAALDELETMDDCMIHIIENYAWNPDSEGSKFIMQLLERKLS